MDKKTFVKEIRTQLQLSCCEIEVLKGPEKKKRQRFEECGILIGRSKENLFSLEKDPSISGKHCAFIYEEGIGYRLVDYNSKNGTWIGSIRITEVLLSKTTVIRVGDSIIKFTPIENIHYIQEEAEEIVSGLFFRDKKMKELCLKVKKLFELNISILFRGENGTGKGAFASIIREDCESKGIPFVKVNCSAIPNGLLESELFGYAKGAFNNAFRNHKGAFKRADKGVLFLDEIGDLPLDLQVKILGALDQHKGYYEFTPLGSEKTEKSKFFLITATNRDLVQKIKMGEFRDDLYYRIKRYRIDIPPLRERPEDIDCLLEHFFLSKKIIDFSFSDKFKKRVAGHHWKGNIREFLGAIEGAYANALIDNKKIIDDNHLELEDIQSSPFSFSLSVNDLPPYKEIEQKLRKEYLEKVLKLSNNSSQKASEIMGVGQRTINNWKNEFNLR